MNAQLFEYLLRLGDNALILSQRLSACCGHGPVLEEDLAMTNVALDLLGQARLWLSYAAEIEAKGRDEDQLAFLRDAHEFRNVLLVEQPNSHFGDTLARQYYFDAWHSLLLQQLQRSNDVRIAAIAEKAVKETAYHLQRSRDWIIRLGDGTEESHRKIQTSLNELWRYTGELFEVDAIDLALQAQCGDLSALYEPWLEEVNDTLCAATLKLPEESWMQRGGKRGVHSENLGYLLAEMQFLQRAYPGATW